MSEKNTCNIYDKVVDIVGEENVHTDEPMSRHTTFRIGGNADYLSNRVTRMRLQR